MLRMLYFKVGRLGKLNLFDQVVQKTLDSLMKPIECKLTLKFLHIFSYLHEKRPRRTNISMYLPSKRSLIITQAYNIKV